MATVTDDLVRLYTSCDAVALGAHVRRKDISVAEAVEAYTMGSAYAEFQDTAKGSITPGKLADMVILSDDIFTIPPEKIRDVHVLKTILGGKLVFDASAPGK